MLHKIDFGRLKINKNDVKKQERGTINTFYKKNRKFVVTVSDNGPVTVIYNIKKYVLHASIKWLNSGTKAYIKLDCLNCITKYNKHMGRVHSIDAMDGVYRTDVCGMKWL